VRYGICNWIFGKEPLNTTLERLARYGYDGIELSAEPSLYELQEVKRLVRDHGLAVLGLTPSADWPTETRDLTNPDPNKRARAVDYCKSCVDMAAELNAAYAGVLPTPSGRFFGLGSYADEWQWAVEGMHKVGEYARSVGVPVAVEILNRYEAFLLNTTSQGLRFVKDVGCEAVKLILDVFHMHLEEVDLHSALRQAQNVLVTLHLADTNRQGLGRGHLDLPALFRTLREIGYDGSICLEFNAPGPNPFVAVKDDRSMVCLEAYTRESISLLRALEQIGNNHNTCGE
jgi:D-psicose/D-tagatose/L-ribulose 3-epimerase